MQSGAPRRVTPFDGDGIGSWGSVLGALLAARHPELLQGYVGKAQVVSHPEADAHLLKAELVSRIDVIVRQRGITQTEAGRLLGLSQPDVSRLLRGDFREYSLERLSLWE